MIPNNDPNNDNMEYTHDYDDNDDIDLPESKKKVSIVKYLFTPSFNVVFFSMHELIIFSFSIFFNLCFT